MQDIFCWLSHAATHAPIHYTCCYMPHITCCYMPHILLQAFSYLANGETPPAPPKKERFRKMYCFDCGNNMLFTLSLLILLIRRTIVWPSHWLRDDPIVLIPLDFFEWTNFKLKILNLSKPQSDPFKPWSNNVRQWLKKQLSDMSILLCSNYIQRHRNRKQSLRKRQFATINVFVFSLAFWPFIDCSHTCTAIHGKIHYLLATVVLFCFSVGLVGESWIKLIKDFALAACALISFLGYRLLLYKVMRRQKECCLQD